MESAPVPDPHSSYLEFDGAFTDRLLLCTPLFREFVRLLPKYKGLFVSERLLRLLTGNYDPGCMSNRLLTKLREQITRSYNAIQAIPRSLTLHELKNTHDRALQAVVENNVQQCQALLPILECVNRANYRRYLKRKLPEFVQRVDGQQTFTVFAVTVQNDLFHFACYAPRSQVVHVIACVMTQGSILLNQNAPDSFLERQQALRFKSWLWLRRCVDLYWGITLKQIELPIVREPRFGFKPEENALEGVGWVVQYMKHRHPSAFCPLHYLLLETHKFMQVPAWIQSMVLALVMGTHGRIGMASCLSVLDGNLIGFISDIAFEDYRELLVACKTRMDRDMGSKTVPPLNPGMSDLY